MITDERRAIRLERVVVGVDFSTPAIAAAKWVAGHLAPAAELVLAHVIDVPKPPSFARGVMPPPSEIESAARDFAEARLAEIASLLGADRVRTLVRVGAPHEVLTTVAREANADLLVVAPHGDRPRPWRMLGNTAERVVRTATMPVLIVGNARAAAPSRILVAVDEAEVTPLVLEWARHIALSFDASVTALHVLSHGEYGHVALMAELLTQDHGAASERVEQVVRDAGVRWLRALATDELGGERVDAAVTFGKAGDAILAMAGNMDAHLIIMGRRGSGQIAPAMLGSTVSTVLRGATCPVLVVTETAGHTRDRQGG